MKCIRCGSYAINHGSHGRDGTDPDLCDVCYWRKRAEEKLSPDKPLSAQERFAHRPRNQRNR